MRIARPYPNGVCTNRSDKVRMNLKPYELIQLALVWIDGRMTNCDEVFMKYLITGGAGFIGSSLAKYLVDEGVPRRRS